MPQENKNDIIFYEQLINEIEENITTDDFPTWKKGNRIYDLYQNADDRTKGMFDHLFVHLCGYSLKTLIENVTTQTQEQHTDNGSA